MMGSGKTTVGKVLSGVLGYSFFDWFVLKLLITHGFSRNNIHALNESGNDGGSMKGNSLETESTKEYALDSGNKATRYMVLCLGLLKFYLKSLVWGIQIRIISKNLRKLLK